MLMRLSDLQSYNILLVGGDMYFSSSSSFSFLFFVLFFHLCMPKWYWNFCIYLYLLPK